MTRDKASRLAMGPAGTSLWKTWQAWFLASLATLPRLFSVEPTNTALLILVGGLVESLIGYFKRELPKSSKRSGAKRETKKDSTPLGPPATTSCRLTPEETL